MCFPLSFYIPLLQVCVSICAWVCAGNMSICMFKLRLRLKFVERVWVVYEVTTVLILTLPHCLTFHLLSSSLHYWRLLAHYMYNGENQEVTMQVKIIIGIIYAKWMRAMDKEWIYSLIKLGIYKGDPFRILCRLKFR